MCSYIAHHHTSITHNSLHDDLWHKIMHHYVFILARHVVTDKEESWKELKKKEKKKKCPKTLSHTSRDTHSLRVEWKCVRNENNFGAHSEKSLFIFTFCFSVSDSEVSLGSHYNTKIHAYGPALFGKQYKTYFFFSPTCLCYSTKYCTTRSQKTVVCSVRIKDRFSISFLHTRLNPLSVVLCVTFELQHYKP